MSATVLSLVAAFPASAQTWNWLDYFQSPPGACTYEKSSDPTSSGLRIYSLNRSCNLTGRGSGPLYGLYKGGWAEESFVAVNGWLYLVTEEHPNLCGGSYGWRLFEEVPCWGCAPHNSQGKHGVLWAKLNATGVERWNGVPYFQLHCDYNCRGANDLNHSTHIFQAGGDPAEQAILGTIWDKLMDCRSGTCRGPIAMNVAMTRGYLYPNSDQGCPSHHEAIEEYWYGRADITRDGVNNPQPIGQVRFLAWEYDHATCSHKVKEEPSGGWTAVLKNCSNVIDCPYC